MVSSIFFNIILCLACFAIGYWCAIADDPTPPKDDYEGN